MHKECSGHKKTQNYVSELKFINMMCILDDVDVSETMVKVF